MPVTDRPFTAPEQTVEPGWIDYNGHMNVGYYSIAFDRAIEHFLTDALGVGEAWVAETGQGPYALQSHIHYLDELLEGAAFRVSFRLLDADAKRLHVFAEMTRVSDGALCATLEQLLMNVDLTTRRSVAYPEAAQARIAALCHAHAGLERPAQAGAPIGIRRKG
ncbi:thioesterase family protein [Oceanicella sp. SM1341]|uniref:thioesterase family protein n=1 Tax=Oceanicella sp. SM1341 TaxID=1548889 RepID=UPI000E49B9AA|nr:thioesterase family protein [Oceanicella sp. SM1341]